MATVTSKWQYSEEEIRAKLEELGYNNVPDSALKEFSDDLHRLISTESSKESLAVGNYSSSTASTFNSSSTTITNSELSASHEESETRHELAHQYKDRVPLVHHEDVGYYQKQLYPKESQVKQAYPPFAVHSSQYIAAEKENQAEPGHTIALRLAQKRKVLRRKNGKAQVFDESFTNSTSATDISDVEQRLLDLPLKDENASIDDDQSEGFSVWQQNGKNRNVLPSFIRPSDSSSRGIRKTDPVSRYHQFKHEWRLKKVPGEKTHKNLRWSTREQMLQYETFEKPRRSYIPNNYVAPTDKKRQALRWEVRSTLANT